MLSLFFQVWSMYTYAFTDLGYVGIYVAIGLSTAIFAFVRILVTVTGTVTASRSVHLQLLEKVMKPSTSPELDGVIETRAMVLSPSPMKPGVKSGPAGGLPVVT